MYRVYQVTGLWFAFVPHDATAALPLEGARYVGESTDAPVVGVYTPYGRVLHVFDVTRGGCGWYDVYMVNGHQRRKDSRDV